MRRLPAKAAGNRRGVLRYAVSAIVHDPGHVKQRRLNSVFPYFGVVLSIGKILMLDSVTLSPDASPLRLAQRDISD